MVNAQYEARLVPGPDQAVPRASGQLTTICGPPSEFRQVVYHGNPITG